MAIEKQKKSRQQIYKESDQRRKDQLKLNAIRNVPEKTVERLEALAKKFGNKKVATLKAIDFLYDETFNKS